MDLNRSEMRVRMAFLTKDRDRVPANSGFSLSLSIFYKNYQALPAAIARWLDRLKPNEVVSPRRELLYVRNSEERRRLQ